MAQHVPAGMDPAAVEHDLRTPAHAVTAKLDLRALQAYRLAGRLSIAIGAVLWLVALASGGTRGFVLNLLAGTLAVVLGVVVVVGERHYRRRVAAVPVVET